MEGEIVDVRNWKWPHVGFESHVLGAVAEEKSKCWTDILQSFVEKQTAMWSRM